MDSTDHIMLFMTRFSMKSLQLMLFSCTPGSVKAESQFIFMSEPVFSIVVYSTDFLSCSEYIIQPSHLCRTVLKDKVPFFNILKEKLKRKSRVKE